MKSDAVVMGAVMGVVVCAALAATDVSAQSRRGPGRPPSGSGGAMGTAAARAAVPRTGRPVSRGYVPTRVYPRVFDARPYRPYYNPYRSGFSVGFYSGLGYPYRNGSYYGYPYNYNYPFNYTYFHNYRYTYPYAAYAYAPYRYALPPPAYVTAVPGYAYGGVRIQGAPHDAQVFVDGYYVGIVDDFDGAFQHANLRPGPHRVEIRAPGLAPVMFSVNVTPGQTITYHAGMR